MSTALITGGSAGLGRALATALHARGWTVILTGRRKDALTQVAEALGTHAHPVPGDITTADHRTTLTELVERIGGLDLLVHNASTLGASPLPRLADLEPATLEQTWRTNTAAPLELTRALLPALRRRRGIVLSVTSDAAAEHYEGWGGYGATKAALEHITLTLGAEEPDLAAYAVDPGDMRTQMHQDAFPGEDISDRPEPETVVPALLALIDSRPADGRYRAAELAPAFGAAAASAGPDDSARATGSTGSADLAGMLR